MWQRKFTYFYLLTATVLSGIPQGSVLRPILTWSCEMCYLSFRRLYYNFPTNNNQRRRTSATFRHKFIGAMVSEMATHFLPQKTSYHFITLPSWEVHPSSTRARTCFWAKRSGTYLLCRAKIWWIHFGESKKASAIAGLIRINFSYLDGPLFKKLYLPLRDHILSMDQ